MVAGVTTPARLADVYAAYKILRAAGKGRWPFSDETAIKVAKGRLKPKGTT